jgi:hypothetical protein
MAYILYYIYLGLKANEERSRVPIYVSANKLPLKGKRLVAAAMNDLGLRQLFEDAWWSRETQGEVYLEMAGDVDLDFRNDLEARLREEKENRVNPPSREFLEKRKPRKVNYVYCAHGLVPDWVDAQYVSLKRLLGSSNL